ncbi:MAG: hypothetical protein JNK33_06190 [Candidatus Doudnabacteria bacterium]|nr:hypothetical protein [Candidatus Doudnabacteria bacterium]
MRNKHLLVAILALACAIASLSTSITAPVVAAQDRISADCLGSPAVLRTAGKGVNTEASYKSSDILVYIEKSDKTISMFGPAYTPASGALENDHWFQPPSCPEEKAAIEAAVKAKFAKTHKNYKFEWSGPLSGQ